MKRILSVLLAFAFALGISTSALAMGGAAAVCGGAHPAGAGVDFAFMQMCRTFTPGASSVPITVPEPGIPNFVEQNVPGIGVLFILPNTTLGGPNDDFTLTIDALGKKDPFLSIGFAITNNLIVAQNFKIDTVIPITIMGPSESTSSISGAVGDGVFNDGATVSPGPGNTDIFISDVDGTSLGVDIAGFSITQAEIDDPNTLGGYGFAGGPVDFPFGPGSYTLSLLLDATLDPFDTFTGIARVDIDPYYVGAVPEPATLLLLGSGLAGFGILGQWKKYRGTKV